MKKMSTMLLTLTCLAALNMSAHTQHLENTNTSRNMHTSVKEVVFKNGNIEEVIIRMGSQDGISKNDKAEISINKDGNQIILGTLPVKKVKNAYAVCNNEASQEVLQAIISACRNKKEILVKMIQEEQPFITRMDYDADY